VKSPKGFGRNYFTLSAIQAYSAHTLIQQCAARVYANSVQMAEECDDETEEELEDVLCAAELDLPTHSGHCRGCFRPVTRRRIIENSRQKLFITTHRFSNSVSSPPTDQSAFMSKKSTLSRKPLMNKTVLSVAALAALSLALPARAVILQPLTVTSTSLGDTELNAPESTEIYTQEDIEKAHVQSVYEFLTRQTSVIATPSYGNAVTQRLDMRGYGITNGYENIAVSVNGRRMNNVDGVPQLLSSIPPGAVERIEILKGSGVVTGGNGANAGVINITTKKNSDKEVMVYGGSYGTVNGSFYVGHHDDNVALSVQGEAYKTNGIRHIDTDQNRDRQKMSNGRFDLA
jgi:hypothetical protein